MSEETREYFYRDQPDFVVKGWLVPEFGEYVVIGPDGTAAHFPEDEFHERWALVPEA